MSKSPAPGLYSPAFEHDSCGFGLVARLDDRPQRAIVDAALVALDRLTHRGAVAADGRSGDGCGLLLRRPEAFLAAIAAEAGLAWRPDDACGLVFLPDDDAGDARCREALAGALQARGLAVSGWREVPVDQAACGEVARRGLPRLAQVFVHAPGDGDGDAAGFERRLFLARRTAERALAGQPGFYVASLSAATLAYKAMVLPAALPSLFPDLARADLASSAVVFHQRFSTNTAPAWALAQPFRVLAHNGEINTIAGNRCWALARAAHWRTPHFDLAELQPLVSLEGSDSQSLDNMLELLLMGGMDLLSAMQKRWSGPEHSCVPVVAVTADAFEETQQRCLAAGFSRCLAKPFRVEEISNLLQKLGVGPTRPASH